MYIPGLLSLLWLLSWSLLLSSPSSLWLSTLLLSLSHHLMNNDSHYYFFFLMLSYFIFFYLFTLFYDASLLWCLILLCHSLTVTLNVAKLYKDKKTIVNIVVCYYYRHPFFLRTEEAREGQRARNSKRGEINN